MPSAAPAVAHSAIAVGTVDSDNALAEFSNSGPAARSGAIKPDVLAPGVGIRSTAIGGGTLVLSGTSMSAPYVSGLAALLVEKHSDWTRSTSSRHLSARPLRSRRWRS